MLLAFAGGMFALLMGAREALLHIPFESQFFVLAGIILFAISVIFSSLVTWVRSYRIDPNPEALANEYLNQAPDEPFIRQVTIHGKIHLLSQTFSVGKRLKHQYVKVVLDTQRAQLTVYVKGRVFKRWTYPFLKK